MELLSPNLQNIEKIKKDRKDIFIECFVNSNWKKDGGRILLTSPNLEIGNSVMFDIYGKSHQMYAKLGYRSFMKLKGFIDDLLNEIEIPEDEI